MRCQRCQHDNRPGAKFCEECAAPFARRCANCGTDLSATAKFCSECAHPAQAQAAAPAGRDVAPEAYTPKHLAERILTSKAALEGDCFRSGLMAASIGRIDVVSCSLTSQDTSSVGKSAGEATSAARTEPALEVRHHWPDLAAVREVQRQLSW